MHSARRVIEANYPKSNLTLALCRLSKTYLLPPTSPPHDVIGPINPVSNLRPVIFHIPAVETDLQKKYRMAREDVQKWNEEFWHKHNSNFIKERQKFLTSNKANEENYSLSADQMSIFYKEFLDKNWSLHLNYNREWYKKNISLLKMAFQVILESLCRKLNLF